MCACCLCSAKLSHSYVTPHFQHTISRFIHPKMHYRSVMRATACVLLLSYGLAGKFGVPICFDLPKREGMVRATVAVTDPHDDKWLVATVSGGMTFNTSSSQGIHDKGCVYWDGLDDNWRPVPPGAYGLKGILMNASIWDFDGKPHTLIPEFDGSISPFTRTKDQNNNIIPASDLHHVVGGDPVGSPFSSVSTNINFPQRRPRANFYHKYLENDCNNYLVALDRPQGPSQLVSKWPDAGIQGGLQTSTDGLSIWSSFETYKSGDHTKFLYRADTPAAGSRTEGLHLQAKPIAGPSHL